MTDWIFKLGQWLQQCFCIHEYVGKRYFPNNIKFVCKKCHRIVKNPPIKLIYKDSNHESNR